MSHLGGEYQRSILGRSKTKFPYPINNRVLNQQPLLRIFPETDFKADFQVWDVIEAMTKPQTGKHLSSVQVIFSAILY